MSWFMGFRQRLADLFAGGRRDHELDEEIRYHLELETRRQLERGLSPVAARAAALDRFGNPAHITEEARDERGGNHLEGAMQDFQYAIRSLRKQRGYTALALLTLALGIGVTTAAFTVLDTVLIRPLPYRDSERLVLIREVNEKGGEAPPSYPNFVDWRERARGFDGIASAMFAYTTSVVVNGEPERASTMGLSRGFFRVLGATPAAGREFTDDENRIGGPFAVMVTHEYWRNKLGGRLPLGDIIYGGRSVPVVGVAPAGFRLVGSAEFFFPHEQYPGTCRSCRNYVVVGRLSDGATIESAQAGMTTLSKTLFATYGRNETQAVNASVTSLHEYLVQDFRTTLAAIFVAAGLVLLIACTNLVSAQLARGLTRQREIAVRTAIGASRGRIMRQLLIESGVLTAGGTALGCALAFAIVSGVSSVGEGIIPRLHEVAIDGRVLGFAIALAALTSFVIGMYPALRLSQASPGDAMRGASRGTSASVGGRVWTALIGFEIAVGVVLTIGSALMLRTMQNILDNDVGFDPRGLVTALMSPDTMPYSEIERVRAELEGVPGVEGVGLVSGMPLNWGNQSGPILRPTDSQSNWPGMAGFRVISADYFGVMRQPILRGRSFQPTDVHGATPVAIITPGIANLLWPGENPIGKQVRTNYLIEEWLTVVGVVAEASRWDDAKGSQNEIFVALAQFPERARNQLVAVVRSSENPQALIPSLRARLRAVAPMLPARFDTIEERIARTAADRRFAMLALFTFAGIALLLAGVGVYGVMSYSVAARNHEIGVRLALGSTPAGILRLVLGTAGTMAAIGVVGGAIGGWMATRFIGSILYGVSRADPMAYIAAVGFLCLAALAGALAPALRSSRVDPLEAIRAD